MLPACLAGHPSGLRSQCMRLTSCLLASRDHSSGVLPQALGSVMAARSICSTSTHHTAAIGVISEGVGHGKHPVVRYQYITL